MKYVWFSVLNTSMYIQLYESDLLSKQKSKYNITIHKFKKNYISTKTFSWKVIKNCIYLLQDGIRILKMYSNILESSIYIFRQ